MARETERDSESLVTTTTAAARPHLTCLLACLPAPVYIDLCHYCRLQYNNNTSPPPQHPYPSHPTPSHPSLDSSLLPVPSAEPATTTPNGPSASDEPGLNHDPRGPPSALLCCRAAALVAAAVLLLTSPLHRPHHRAANWTPTLPGQPSLCNYRQPTCPSQTLLLTRAVSVELSSAALLA